MGQLTFQATLGGAVNLVGPNTASTTSFTLPSADGTSGQALTTNGSGTLSFATVATSAATPTALGTVYGKQTTSGGTPYLTAIGYNAGASTTGVGVTAVGTEALYTNSTGARSTAMGYRAGYSNTGDNNLFVGNQSGFTNTTGTGNSFVGGMDSNNWPPGYYNTSGSDNSAFGGGALRANTTGSFNTAVGTDSLHLNTTASNNTAVGYQAAYANTTGVQITALGNQAARAGTTANYITAIGHNTLISNTTGSDNIAVGASAMEGNTTGNNNVSVGDAALLNNTTGSSNTAVGQSAGWAGGSNSNTTGSNNTFIGNGAVGSSATASNVITLGNSSIATLRCQQTSITSLSDRRDKTDIVDIPAGMNFIQQLRPVSFKWNMRDGAKVGIPEFGFIAQELQEAQVASGVIVPNLVSTENPEKLEASQGTLIPILVKAIQELKAEFDAYKLTHP